MDYSKDQWNLNVTSKGFRIRYRLHSAARLSDLRQRRLNKTAINKDEVSIRTTNSFNQIRNIKVSKQRQRKRTKRWTRGDLVQGRSRHSSKGGCQELASIFRIRTPETKNHPSSLLLFNPWLSSSSSSRKRASLRFLISARLRNRLGRGHHESSSNNLPLKC